MAVSENALRAVSKSKKDMVLFKNEKIIPNKMYELVCKEDYTYPLGGQVHFKAKVPTMVSGLFAKNIVKLTRGKVQFVDKDLLSDNIADSSRDDEIEQLKAAVKSLTDKKSSHEVVKNVVPEVKTKAKKTKTKK